LDAAGVHLEDVSKRYGRGPWILSGITLSLSQGESVHIAGPNGSGKSTLLRLIAGVSRPSRGTITGRPAQIGYVPDRFPADGTMSSLAYLTHLGRMRGLRTASEQARRLLDRLDLNGGLRAPIRALSKGNAQKVALAQALMVPPDLLVLDEPWSGLDAAAHGVLGEILHEVPAVVFTDHRESVARRHATRTYSLGSLVRSAAHIVVTDRHGTAAPLPPGLDAVSIAPGMLSLEVPPDDCDDLLSLLLARNWSIEEVRRS
jgi:ABC-type multidrug transport system ATPase subunit